MSPHAPPHLQHIAPVLLAGEDVKYLSKPDMGQVILLEAGVVLVLFVMLFPVISLFGGLPAGLSAAASLLFAIGGAVILYCTIGARQYVITDQRLLILSGFTHEVHDSCELDEIQALSVAKYTKSLTVECKNGKFIKLWAIANQPAARAALSRQTPPQN